MQFKRPKHVCIGHIVQFVQIGQFSNQPLNQQHAEIEIAANW